VNKQPGYTDDAAGAAAPQDRVGDTAAAAKSKKIRVRLIYILIMLWVGRVAIFIRRRYDYSAIDMLAMVQIGVVGAILVFFLIFPMANFRQQIKNSSLKFYFLYLLIGAASALWSINPAFSLYRSMEAFAMSAAVLYFCASAESVEKGIRRVQLIMWPILLAIWVAGMMRQGFSLTLKDNGFGAMAALTACFFSAWILTDKTIRNKNKYFQMGLGIFFVLVSMSLASWWSFWFGACYCAFLTRRKAMVLALILVGVTIFITLGQDTRQKLLIRDKDYEHLEEMTGRKILWTDYMTASRERPMLGFGFAMGGREVGTVYTTNTHNAFFAALLGTGWVGVVTLGLFFLTLARELLRYRHYRYPPWLACASALAAGFLNTMSVSILGEQFDAPTAVFMALLGLHMVFLREAKQQFQEKQKQRQIRFQPRTVFHRG
jgi:hypothetical protein